jgi:hypothetical protein
MDSRPVHGISTFPTYKSKVTRKGTSVQGAYEKQEIWRPTIWELYNSGMGGTDLQDQFNRYYRSQVRCRKWPPRIFTHFLMASLTNASILYKQSKSLVNNQFHLLDFLDEFMECVKELKDDRHVQESSDREDIQSEEERPVLAKRRYHAETMIKDTKRLKTGSNTPCHDFSDRKQCLVCKKKRTSKCSECGVHLCFSEASAGPENCFWRYHNLEAFTLS